MGMGRSNIDAYFIIYVFNQSFGLDERMKGELRRFSRAISTLFPLELSRYSGRTGSHAPH